MKTEPTDAAKTAAPTPQPAAGANGEATPFGGRQSGPSPIEAEETGFGRKSVVSIVAIALSLLLGGGIFSALASQRPEPPQRPVPLRTFNVVVYEVRPTDFQEIVTGFGTARADRSVAVSAEVSGLVTETHEDLEVGTRVEGPRVVPSADGVRSERPPADLLVRIDPATYEQRVGRLDRQIEQLKRQIEQLRAEEENERRLIETQKRNLASAREELESKQRSLRAGAGSSTAVRQAEQTVNQYEETLVRTQNSLSLVEVREAQLQSQVEAAKADREVANLDVQRTEIRAPFSGVLDDVMVERGQFVRTGDPLLSVTDLDHIEVPVSLTQEQYARVAPLLEAGERPRVELSVNETAEPQWTGRLVRAAPVADAATRTVDVFVEVENSAQASPLLPGTFVHARIAGPMIQDAIAVPRDAIVRGEVFLAEEDVAAAVRERVRLLNTSDDPDAAAEAKLAALGEEVRGKLRSATAKRVQVGRTLQTFAFAESGLEPGDLVVMTNLDIIYDNALLIPQETVTAAEELQRQNAIALRVAE